MLHRVEGETYDATWRALHARVFSGRPANERPFKSQDWVMYLIGGGLCADSADLEAIYRAANSVGDVEVVIVDGDGEFASEPPLNLRLTRSDFEEVRCNSVFGQTTAHIFGSSGRWGLVTHHEGFAVFGCEREVAVEFERFAGGVDAIRARFLEASPGIGFGAQGREFVAGLRAMVDWSERG